MCKFYKLNFFLIIFLILNCFNFRVAHAEVGYKINTTSVESVSDKILKDLFGQTGYRVATQEEIDNLRSRAKTEVPELTNKYPLIFGVTPDSIPVGSDFQNQYNTYCKNNNDGYTNVYSKVGADVREWINAAIDSLKSETIPSNDNKVSYTVYSSPIVIRSTFSDGYVANIQLPNHIVKLDIWTETKMLDPAWAYRPYVTIMHFDETFEDGHFAPDSFQYNSTTSFGVTYDSPNLIEIVKDTPFTNYVPYPTTQDEVTSNTKVPVEIAVPVKTDTSGYITPTTPTVTYPSVKVAPDTGGKATTSDTVMTFTTPTIDPNTGEVVDPVTDTGTDTNTNPDGTVDTDNPYDVPDNAVPDLDFSPLNVVTRKFPFCIPWDLWQCYKVFEGNEEPLKYHFNTIQVDCTPLGVTGFTVIPAFDIDFSKYPQFDNLRKIIKYLELMIFIVFLIVKTRNLIRG